MNIMFPKDIIEIIRREVEKCKFDNVLGELEQIEHKYSDRCIPSCLQEEYHKITMHYNKYKKSFYYLSIISGHCSSKIITRKKLGKEEYFEIRNVPYKKNVEFISQYNDSYCENHIEKNTSYLIMNKIIENWNRGMSYQSIKFIARANDIKWRVYY